MRCKDSLRVVTGVFLATCWISVALAEVKLAAVIGDNMLLHGNLPSKSSRSKTPWK